MLVTVQSLQCKDPFLIIVFKLINLFILRQSFPVQPWVSQKWLCKSVWPHLNLRDLPAKYLFFFNSPNPKASPYKIVLIYQQLPLHQLHFIELLVICALASLYSTISYLCTDFSLQYYQLSLHQLHFIGSIFSVLTLFISCSLTENYFVRRCHLHTGDSSKFRDQIKLYTFKWKHQKLFIIISDNGISTLFIG